MKSDNYERWVPTEELPGDLYFFELHNESGVLTILLKKFELPDKVLVIKFDGILAYRVVQEAGRLKTIYENDSLGAFNTTTDSALLRWFTEESGGIFDDSGLIHYVICNSDNIIDVISGPPVIVEWQDLGSVR